VGPVGGDGRDEAVELIALLLELLYEALDGALGKRLGLAALEGDQSGLTDERVAFLLIDYPNVLIFLQIPPQKNNKY
jgi:hypothetical protein